jgi:hypothetical protein
MSRTYRNNDGDRRIRVKGVRRNPPDLRRLSRALIELAIAQAEQEAAAEAEAQRLQGGPVKAEPVDAPATPPNEEDSE